MLDTTFSVSINCCGRGQFNVAECLEQIKKTPLRMAEPPAAQHGANSLILELMLDAPVGGPRS